VFLFKFLFNNKIGKKTAKLWIY